MSLCFTQPQSVPGVCDFLLSDKSNLSYIKNGPGPSKPYNDDTLFVNVPEDVK